MEMMTPFPVPTQSRFPPISRAVIRTNEKPNFPVPVNQIQHKAEISSCRSEFCKLITLSRTQRAERVTEHLADIGLDVNILKVLMCERVVQSQCRVQTDGHPYAVSDPGELPDLAFSARVSVE